MMDVNLQLPPADPLIVSLIVMIKFWSIIVLHSSEYAVSYWLPFIMGAFPGKFPWPGF